MSRTADLQAICAQLQAFVHSLQPHQSTTAGAENQQGCTTDDHQTAEHPSARLSVELKRCCRTLIASTERARFQAEEFQDLGLITWLTERQQFLKAVLRRHDTAIGNTVSENSVQPMTVNTHSCLLELPAELREQIWMHAVTQWTPASEIEVGGPSTCAVSQCKALVKRPIRMDRFNRPSPPPITRVSHQLRSETLHLYYQCNIFECWRPMSWLKDWSQSTFVEWLAFLGPERIKWLQHIVLLYKHETELEHDVHSALADEGLVLVACAIEDKQELSEYELCFEELGLPRHFGKKRRRGRWVAGSAAS